MKRYRGENSNVDDIAARFDKHLEEPVHIRLTASAAIANVSPGRYNLYAVLEKIPNQRRSRGRYKSKRING